MKRGSVVICHYFKTNDTYFIMFRVVRTFLKRELTEAVRSFVPNTSRYFDERRVNGEW